MYQNLFKFLEKNEVVLDEKLKNTIIESLNLAVKEKSDTFETQIKDLKKKNSDMVDILKEAAEEIKSLRSAKSKEVDKAVKLFEEKMVNNISRYLDYKLVELVPQHLLEAQAKLEVYEPLVESIKASFVEKGLKLDEKGFGILKEAKEEILSYREKLDSAVKRNMQLEEASEKLLGKYLLKEKCEGLTTVQKKKINKLLENASYEEIEKRFNTVRDLIINEADTKEDEMILEEHKTSKVSDEYSPESKDESNKKDEYGAYLV